MSFYTGLTIIWGDVWQSLIINILSGIVVSIAFLFFLLYFLRPKFIISEYICLSVENVKGESDTIVKKPLYSFKLVNKSIYHAFDAKVELHLMKPNNHVQGRVDLQLKSLPLRTSNMNHIKRYRKRYHKNDPSALFAIQVHTNEHISEMLQQENTYLELKVTVRHGLTGLADTFTQQFGNTDVIREDHKFEFAKNLKTIPINKSA